MSCRYLNTIGDGDRHRKSDEEEIIGKELYLGWPVDAYRVRAPAPSEDFFDKYDPFEFLVVAQLYIEDPLVNSDSALAENVCLPKDFVHNILRKLEDREVVEPGEFRLTDKKKEEIEKAEKEIEDERNRANGEKREGVSGKCSMFLVFREAVTGRILPGCIPLPDDDEKVSRALMLEDDEVSQYNPIVLERNEKVSHALTNEDVRRVIRSCGVKGIPRISPYADVVLDMAEPYYLLCKIAVRRSDGEDRIWNPFECGSEYSLALEAALEEAMDRNSGLCAEIEEWKRNLENKIPDGCKVGKHVNLPFDKRLVESRYPKLAVALVTAYRSSPPSISDWFSVLEWGFHYHLADDSERISSTLSGMATAEFDKMANAALQELGWADCHLPCRRPSERQIDDFRNEKCALLKTLFPIMLIFEAWPGAALHKIHDEFPAFQDFVVRMRKLRNAKSHGGEVGNEMPMSCAEARDFVKSLVTALLPDVEFSEEAPEEGLADAMTDARFKAGNDIRSDYGRKIYSALPKTAKEHLVNAQMEFNALEADGNAWKLVREIASAMQSMLDGVLKDMSRKRSERCFEDARERLSKLGFSQLSDAFMGVSQSRVRKCLSGDGAESLGVAGLALAICGDDGMLAQIAGRDAEFFNFIGHVHERRGHDRQIVLSEDERTTLKIRLKRFVKILMEVCNGQEK